VFNNRCKVKNSKWLADLSMLKDTRDQKQLRAHAPKNINDLSVTKASMKKT